MSARFPKLILPKGYLSWSQMSCWMSNPARYAREYFEDGEKLDTLYLRFGKAFAKMVEDLEAIEELARSHPMDESMRLVLAALDTEGESEFQIGRSGREGDASPPCVVRGEVPVLSFLDKYVHRDGSIKEYKTGLAPWTLAKVQKHDQLTFYGVSLRWSGKPLPPHADLYWIPTREIEQEHRDFFRGGPKVIAATGKVHAFHREFDPREFDRMEDLISRVAREISDAYQEHLTQL
jgi:hypothetical protein